MQAEPRAAGRPSGPRGLRCAGGGAWIVLAVALVATPALGEERSGADGDGDGRVLFEMACATCHLGGGGLLGAPRTPDLFEDPLPRGEDAAAIERAIRQGVARPRMPSFATGLAPREIDAIVEYVLARRAAARAGGAPR